MEIVANAKINLCLDVVRRRDDGYHEMDMIMVPLQLHDTLWVEFASQDHFVCRNQSIVMDEHNTIVKAVKLMRETFSLSHAYQVELEKVIPMEAGLAGGSADAAAVMKAIWQMEQLPCTLEELAMLGKQIGADVPFCIRNTCALVQGIGENITPFTNHCSFHVLLVKPKEGVSTGKAFQMLDFSKCEHPNTNKCKEALQNGDVLSFYQNSKNTLEYSAFQLVPHLQAIKTKLQDSGFPFVLMSGSGSTMFALSEDIDFLRQQANLLKEEYPFVCVTSILTDAMIERIQ